jgi:serine/threonine protein kinase
LLVCGDVLKTALEFLHRHSYTHNDVTPNNIMCKIGQSRQPFLIDFGLATEIESMDLKKFQGTPRYAHSDIFQKYGSNDCWCGKPEYDFAGLAFSMATLLSVNTRRPWSNFQPVNIHSKVSCKAKLRWKEFVEWVNFRSDTSENLLQEAKFGGKWLEWCNDKIIGDDNESGN